VGAVEWQFFRIKISGFRISMSRFRISMSQKQPNASDTTTKREQGCIFENINRFKKKEH